MPSITRKIYTQGWVAITGASGAFLNCAIGTGFNGVVLTGVQSANMTINSPRQDVNAFGILGTIAKVQTEPQAATMEVSMVLSPGNSGSRFLSGLAMDASRPTPSGCTVTASGVGKLTSAIMTSFRLEAAQGGLPTLSMTFEGNSGLFPNPTSAPTDLNTVTVDVVTPGADFGTIYWSNTSNKGGLTGCPQSVRTTWEMPVERVNCLGNDINSPAIYSRPPGTCSFVAEGIDSAIHDAFVTGVDIGLFKFRYGGSIRETTRTANMAVGEASATYNITSEAVAMGSYIDGP